MDISVIILNWNTKDLLRESLHSVVAQSRHIALQTIVVDNASEDGSREMVCENFPQVELVVNSTNIGFGAGNNRALPYAKGRYLLFLNSDTVVKENALKMMVDFADQNPDIGILGPKLLNGDGSLQYSCRRFPNIATGFFRSTPLGKLFPNNRHNADYLMKDWDHATPRDVDWVSGAALMLRKTTADQIGCFDEEYYMYCEDVDLCWRCNHAPLPMDASRNWRVTYFPDAEIFHYIGKSSDQVPTRMTYEFHRSQYLFYKKHYLKTTPLLVRPLIPAGIILRAVGQMAKFKLRYWQRRLQGGEKKKRIGEGR